MEIEVTSKRDNALFQRTEVRFLAKHPGEKSPSREALRHEIAKVLSGSKDNTIIDWSRSAFGIPNTRGYAKIYKSKEAALKVERKHILVRNGLLAKEVKDAKPAAEKAPPPPKAEKPAEKSAEKPAEKPAAPPKEAKPAEKPAKEAKPADKPAKEAKK